MMTYITSRRFAVAAAGGLLVALTLSGGAQAVTDTIFKYTTAKTGFYGIHPTAMIPSGNSAAANYSINYTAAALFSGANGCFNAGVNLPQGVTITALSFWARSSTGGDPQAVLFRNNLTSGVTDIIAKKTFVDDSGARIHTNIQITNATLAAVDNVHYMYSFAFCFGGPNDVFHGARIAYTFTNAGD